MIEPREPEDVLSVEPREPCDFWFEVQVRSVPSLAGQTPLNLKKAWCRGFKGGWLPGMPVDSLRRLYQIIASNVDAGFVERGAFLA
jgi:hypothetical protein